jgi:hypothetical protein
LVALPTSRQALANFRTVEADDPRRVQENVVFFRC